MTDIPLPLPGDTDWIDWATEQEDLSDAARDASVAAALAPVQLKRATSGGTWTDAAGTVYNNAARTALRPHPIYWLAAAGAEPPWSANTYDANTTYGDIVNVTA